MRVVVGRTQHRQGVGDVVHRQFPIGILERTARGDEGENCASCRSEAPMAFAKIVGLAVTPRIPSATKAANVPSRSMHG